MHQGSKGAGKRREDEIAVGSLVIPSGDTAKMLDAVEEALNQIAGAIQGTTVVSLADPVGSRRNDGFCVRGANGLHEGAD